MSTEYRRGIPSTAHVEAATRLGLLWRGSDEWLHRFRNRNGQIEVWYFEDPNEMPDWEAPDFAIEDLDFRPIRPDGTPVDWEVLDQEVARVGQRGQPATVTPTTPTAPTTQPQGFRADLWSRICIHFGACVLNRFNVSVSDGSVNEVAIDDASQGLIVRGRLWNWPNTTFAQTPRQRADILARWTVYQELKPLYDLVDGAQGEAAMPRDVAEGLQAPYFRDTSFVVNGRDNSGRVCLHIRDENNHTYSPSTLGFNGTTLNDRLANFAAVLNAVAERRVAERMQSSPLTSAQPEPMLDEAALRSLILNLPNVASITSRIERGSRQRNRYIVRVQLADPNVPLGRALATQIPRNVHVHCEGRGDGGQRGFGGTAAVIFSHTGNREDPVAPPIQEPRRVNVEPRRFADVRPDRHGWRWWRVVSAPNASRVVDQRFEVQGSQWQWLSLGQPRLQEMRVAHWADRTVIPTDEQGNPVSWEAAGFAAEAVREAQESVQRAANDATPARSLGDIEWTVTGQPVTRDMTVEPATGMVRSTHTARIRQAMGYAAGIAPAGFSTESPTPPRSGQFSNNPATPPLTPEGLLSVMQNYAVPDIYITVGTGAKPAQTEAITTLPLALPRFTADELDDVDHSKTTKLDEVTLRRGKLPTVEQIAKYREVRAKRTGGTVADALKESRIDCEVAQYVLERWAGGLGDELALWLLRAVGKYSRSDLRFTQRSVDELARCELTHEAGAIETAEPSPTVQRERQEAEERRQRLAELRQRLAAERVAQPREMAKESDTVSRFDLIEPDPQADPTASIRAWEARQAAAKVRPVAALPRIAKPAAAPRRPAIEVVDAEADGLSRSDIVAALVGRAFNGGC